MNKLPLKLLAVTLIFDIIGFLFFLGLSFSRFPTQLFEMSYRGAWVFNNALILFSQSLIALHCASAVITYSLLYRERLKSRDYQDPSGPFYKLVVLSLVIFLVSVLGGVLLNEITLPGALARQYRFKEETRISRELYTRAGLAESRGDYPEAHELYKRYMELNPNTRPELQERQARMAEQLNSRDPNPEDSPMADNYLDLSPAELLTRARQFEQKEDYFTAYYYGSLAFQVNPDFTEAREFTSLMWSRIEDTTPLREETLRTEIFRRKKLGTTQLSGGRPVEAYYTFLELKELLSAQSREQDPDVETYLALARDASRSVSFLSDDTELAADSPGYRNLFFINPGPADGETEAVFLGRAVPHLPQRGAWMVQDIAVIRWNSRGILYSLKAPFGKILFSGQTGAETGTGGMIFRGIDPVSRDTRYSPEYLEGSSLPDLKDFLPLYITPAQLSGLAEESQGYGMTNLMWLWESRKILEPMGIITRPLERKILEKLLYPFSFLIWLLFSLTFGWSQRHRAGTPAPASWLLLPLLPFLIQRLAELYSAGFLTVLQFFLVLGGFPGALTALLVSQGLLLVLAFVLLAGQSNK